jgi:hypothetical protein
MNTFQLNKVEKMLLALLRASLHQKEAEQAYFQQVSQEDWKLCYRLAARQGVMALAWDGVLTLPADLQPPRALKLTWGMAVQDYEAKYARFCRTIQELSTFYAEHGIVTVQMKGVGLSSYYPVPTHREGGDIDIFTFSADASKMTDAEANRLADQLMMQQGIEVELHSYKHSNFYYKGIPIENHKFFLNVEDYCIAAQVNALLEQCLQPQTTVLLNGECNILIPSPAFNTIFLAFHASQHYGSGIALHHLCDWAMLIKRYGLQLPKELTDKRFLEAIVAFTQLCNRYLGTEVETREDYGMADEILEEILHSRFPHKEGVPVKGKINILLYKTRRFLHRSRISNRILYMPLWKRIWLSVVGHVRRPETIFQTK